jgi:hypothetical protein
MAQSSAEKTYLSAAHLDEIFTGNYVPQPEADFVVGRDGFAMLTFLYNDYVIHYHRNRFNGVMTEEITIHWSYGEYQYFLLRRAEYYGNSKNKEYAGAVNRLAQKLYEAAETLTELY